MRVLVVHNRYRLEGGEERSVELQLEALSRAGVEHALLERSSGEVSRPAAARALLRGGRDAQDVRVAAESLNADVVHAHNTLPLFGPRALEAARAAGAGVVMHLHNLRLFCAIGVAARDGDFADIARQTDGLKAQLTAAHRKLVATCERFRQGRVVH